MFAMLACNFNEVMTAAWGRPTYEKSAKNLVSTKINHKKAVHIMSGNQQHLSLLKIPTDIFYH